MMLVCVKPMKYCSNKELLEIKNNPNMNPIYGSMATIELNYIMEKHGKESFEDVKEEMFVDISTLSKEEMNEWNKKRGYEE